MHERPVITGILGPAERLREENAAHFVPGIGQELTYAVHMQATSPQMPGLIDERNHAFSAT